MTSTPQESAESKAALMARHNATANEVKLAARVETADRVRDRGGRVAAECRQVFRDALNTLGSEHEVTLRAEKGLILAEAREVAARATVSRLVDLSDRCEMLLGETHMTTRQAFAARVKFARYAGNTSWREDYEELIDRAESKHGAQSRLASIKRSNFSVALNDWGQADADREQAYRLAAGEWKWRLERFGEDNSFTYVAAANAISAAIRALQHNKPVIDSRQLQTQAAEVYEQRLRLLGSDHEGTQNSFVALHAIRAELGAADARWLLLSVVGREHEGQITPTIPERLPIALSRAFAIAGDSAMAREWMKTSKEVLEKTYGVDSPRTLGAISFLERSILDGEKADVG